MKTIEIQNCTDYKDKFFKLVVNGKKHVMPYKLTINVDCDKPFKIKVKYFWSLSQEYTFEPKDNLSLQILINKRMLRWNWVWKIFASITPIIVMKIFENSPFLYYAIGIVLVLALIIEFLRNKSYFVIREINTEKNEND